MLQKKDEKEPILPVTGSWNHRMKWVQEKRYVGLRGYGINYLENLRHNPKYSMLQITLGQFTDDSTKLSSSIKSRTHTFISEWPQFIYENENKVRYILDKSLNAIEEETHKVAVRKKIELKQYTMVEAKEEFDLPARKTREEMQKEKDDFNLQAVNQINKTSFNSKSSLI